MLSFISLNTRGLRNNVKRKAIFLFCKEQKSNCVFLQETHSVEEDTKFWKLQWGDSMFFSHGSSHSAGVMILFNRFPGNVIDCKKDPEGHWIMVVVEIQGLNYILLCLYGYNVRSQNKKLMSLLSDQLQKWKLNYLSDRVVIGGDYNVAPDLFLDRLPSRATCHTYEDYILNLTTTNNLCDYWRMKNPFATKFSWFSPSNNGQCSRIDYWLLSNNLSDMVSKCDISASPLTDHCVIILDVLLDKREQITAVWKFNNSLLHNLDFCTEVKALAEEIEALEMSSLNKWEWFKFQIKTVSIKISKSSSKQKKHEQQNIVEGINKLCLKKDLSLEDHILLNKFQSQLDNIYLEKANGAYVRSRARWIEEGEKNSSYFFNLEKQRQTKKKICKLSLQDGITDDPDKINKEIFHFYRELYKSHYSKEAATDFFGKIKEHITPLANDLKNLTEGKLEIGELDKSLKQMPKGKSPGIDGLTVEFYIGFWENIRVCCLTLFWNASLKIVSPLQ
uniref:exodeoxyribonuclease III n=1 Tax=Nothobranchius furzeri TaxID=105023 RepID=A0A1A8UUH3_NOTFU